MNNIMTWNACLINVVMISTRCRILQLISIQIQNMEFNSGIHFKYKLFGLRSSEFEVQTGLFKSPHQIIIIYESQFMVVHVYNNELGTNFRTRVSYTRMSSKIIYFKRFVFSRLVGSDEVMMTLNLRSPYRRV